MVRPPFFVWNIKRCETTGLAGRASEKVQFSAGAVLRYLGNEVWASLKGWDGWDRIAEWVLMTAYCIMI